MKMQAAGRTDETLVKLLRKNVRTPDQTMGDLWAQVVALDLMEERVLALMKAYDLDDLAPLASEIQGRSEKAMRTAIRALPNTPSEMIFEDEISPSWPLHACRIAP